MTLEAAVALLKKYIAHVNDCEGTDFLYEHYDHRVFTDDEWSFLQSLRSEQEGRL